MLHPDFPPWAQNLAAYSFNVVDRALKTTSYGFSVIGGWDKDQMPYVDTMGRNGVHLMIYPTFCSDGITMLSFYKPNIERLATHMEFEGYRIADGRGIAADLRKKRLFWDDVSSAFVNVVWKAETNLIAPGSEFEASSRARTMWTRRHSYYAHDPLRWDFLLQVEDETPYDILYRARQDRVAAAAADVREIGEAKASQVGSRGQSPSP